MAFWERILKNGPGHGAEQYTYDPQKEEPVMMKSICTGETSAGFRDRDSGHYKETMLVRGEEDVQLFMRRCGIKERPRTVY